MGDTIPLLEERRALPDFPPTSREFFTPVRPKTDPCSVAGVKLIEDFHDSRNLCAMQVPIRDRFDTRREQQSLDRATAAEYAADVRAVVYHHIPRVDVPVREFVPILL